MLQVRVYKPKSYREKKILIRNFIGTSYWEYLLVLNGQIYQAHFNLKPKLINRITGVFYTEKEIEGILNYVKSAAMATIDFVLDQNGQPREQKKGDGEISAGVKER